MIRKLLASCAVLALMSTGVLTAAQAEDSPAKPAAVQGTEPAATGLSESGEVLTPDRPTLVSVFVGSSVYSSEDPDSDNIGEINDLVVSEEGSITHAIVGVGGFLGIGEKDVAVPFDELKVVEKDGDIRLIYVATREQLEAAPALDRTAYRQLEHPADQQAATQENAQPRLDGQTQAENQTASTDQNAPSDEQAMAAPPAQDFVDKAAAANMFEIESSKMALEKAQGDETKQFAQRMIDDHSKAGEELQTAVADANAQLKMPETLDQQHADMTSQLEAAEGADFDRLYVDMQAKGHDEAVDLFSAYASAGDNPALQDFANKTLPTLKEHQQAIHAMADASVASNAQPRQEAGGAADATSPEVTFLSLEKDQIWATSLIGKTVYGPDDQSIGEISDLVLQKEGETRVALIDVGGFLGIGEKTVEIPFEEIKVQRGTESNADPKLVVAMTKDQLEQLPEVETDSAAAPATASDTDTEQASNQTGEPATEAEPATTGSVETEYQPVTQNIPAGQLIGATVYGPDDSTIGEIGEVILDPKGGIKAVEIDVGGFLGIGEKPVAVSFDALRVRKDEDGNLFVRVDATKEQLEQAPTYKVSEAQ
jgi:predicted outer membrane protein/sporulation protein YlmC with PRC-barrel domain